MRQMACGLLLLLLMIVGQAETGLTLACEPPAQAGHTHCPQHHGNQEQGGSEHSRASHGGSNCADMLACGASAALTAGASLGVRMAQAVATPLARPLPPPSRADAPGNPPPRA